ncbi:MAG: N-acetylmuramoyl-L-alanine amidase [Spirochaetaceae bacterium]|nr:N-acetylmuramoyl-L-alanine amidase [Spirochaetaceae bacterium]
MAVVVRLIAAAAAVALGVAAVVALALQEAPAEPERFVPLRAPARPHYPGLSLRGVVAPWRVALQIGHLNTDEYPPELAHRRTATGASAGGVAEVDVNRSVAQAAAELLREHGIEVVLLPATVPPEFDADAFVAIHADGGGSSGYKVSPPWRASPASRRLSALLREHYGNVTGMREDLNGVTYNMRGYYAFGGRYRHAIARTTPAAILEMGYLTHPQDRAFLTGQPEVAARGIAVGVLAFLAGHDPLDPTELIPPAPTVLWPARRTVALHAAPTRESTVRSYLRPTDLLMAMGKDGDWYDVRVRGSYRDFGWIHADDLSLDGRQS